MNTAPPSHNNTTAGNPVQSTQKRNPYRFSHHVPERLRDDLQRLLTVWARNRDSAGDVIDDLTRVLNAALAGELEDESRRPDLTGLLAALAQHRRAALDLAATCDRDDGVLI